MLWSQPINESDNSIHSALWVIPTGKRRDKPDANAHVFQWVELCRLCGKMLFIYCYMINIHFFGFILFSTSTSFNSSGLKGHVYGNNKSAGIRNGTVHHIALSAEACFVYPCAMKCAVDLLQLSKELIEVDMALAQFGSVLGYMFGVPKPVLFWSHNLSLDTCSTIDDMNWFVSINQ